MLGVDLDAELHALTQVLTAAGYEVAADSDHNIACSVIARLAPAGSGLSGLDGFPTGCSLTSEKRTSMAILGRRSAQMSATYSHISDPVLKEQYEKVIAAGGQLGGPAAEAMLANQLDQDTLDWLKTNFFKTELELGHCLRTPAEGPCECDLYLRCSKFFTTSEYAPRLRARLVREQELIEDAVERGRPREIERHTAISRRIWDLLNELGEPAEDSPDPSDCR